MLHPITKLALAGVLATLAAVAPRMAAAQNGGTTGTTTAAGLAASDFSIYLQKYDGSQWVQMNTTEQQYFFNRARCQCKADQTDWSGYFKIAIKPAATAQDKINALLRQTGVGSGFAALYAGSNAFDCLSTPTVIGQGQSYCVNLLDPTNYSAGIPNGMAAISAKSVWTSDPIPVARMFNAGGTPVCSKGAGCDDIAGCEISSANLIIYFWTQTNSGRTADVPGLQLAVNVVGQASTSFVPVNVSAEGGNRALTVRWEWPGGISPSGVGSFWGVQIFCVRGAANQVFENGTFSASYQTPQNTCKDFAPASSLGIGGLDPAFLCSGLLPSTSNSYRIKGLQNDIPYGVAVAAIDKYGNASAVTNLAYGKPIATVDFYTEYQNAGGTADGGYCAVASGKRAPGLLGAGLLVALGLLYWRRRRPRNGRGTGPLAALLLTGSLLAAGQANAQSFIEDDMDTSREADEPWRGTPRSYAIEARFGLYTPAIDSEFGANQVHPHQFMFGTKRRPMWQLEFDWQFFKGFGSLALGGVIGYFKENASACKQATLSATNCEPTGDNTSLRLIPLAALLVYRFDVLAEQWKIPLVPYGKIGLNYTFWNVTDGNGETPSAGGGKGRGGTAGWQATVGLALRIDFLDPGAARGFDADAGVNHTYVFFELSSIQSSGLGQKNALRVGDNTWFAGLTFEF